MYSCTGAGGHILWLEEVRHSSPQFFVTLSCAYCLGRPCFSSSDVFRFVGLPFFPSASWPLSFLSLFFLFIRPCLIHARLPDRSRAFVHGHTFLHSWSVPLTVVIGLLHGATFLSGLPLVLFMSPIKPRL